MESSLKQERIVLDIGRKKTCGKRNRMDNIVGGDCTVHRSRGVCTPASPLTTMTINASHTLRYNMLFDLCMYSQTHVVSNFVL